MKNRIYMPPRNIIGSLLSLTIVTWYFIDKVATDNQALKIAFVSLAIIIQAMIVAISTRTRKTRRSFFWSIYDFLTGEGKLPLRLVINALVIIVLLAVGFEISGLEREGGLPQSFIVRFVEVDLYWTFSNFLGISDNSITPIGFSQALTIATTMVGLLFWGMYISILVNKHLEMQNLKNHSASEDEIDYIHYNEKSGSKKPNNNKTDELNSSSNIDNTTNNQHSKAKDGTISFLLLSLTLVIFLPVVLVRQLCKSKN